MAAIHAGEYVLAESTMKTSGSRDARSSGIFGDLAAAHGDLDLAVRYYETAADLYDSESPLRPWWSLLKAAQILHEQRRPEQVLALSRRHSTPWASGLRGTAYLLLRQDAAAEREFRALHDSLAPILGEYVAQNAVEFHRMKAASYAGQHNRVIQIWSKLPRAFWSLYALDVGRAYLNSGMLSEAEYHLRLALLAQLGCFVNGDMQAQHSFLTWSLAQFYLGQVLEKRERQSEAITQYRDFLKRFDHPSDAFPQVAVARRVIAQSQFSQRGERLFSDDFSGSALGSGWTDTPGNWEIADGVVKAAQRPEERRLAERRQAVAFHNGILEFSFRLDGARIALSIGSNVGNLCRLRITPEAMWLQVAKPNESSPLIDQRLASLNIDIQPGVWHKMVVELRGNRMIAQLDDRHTIAGESPRLNVDKIDFGFLVGGRTASFDYVRLYRSRPRKSP